MPRANAPWGDALNWSRPFDLLVLAIFATLRPFLAHRDALFAAGALASPAAQFAAALAAAWAALPLLAPAARPWVALIVMIQPAFLAYALLGRPDHHALFGFALALAAGGFVRILAGPLGRGAAIAFGLLAALPLWISVEFLVVWAAIAVAGALAWLLDPDGLPASRLRDHAVGLALGIAAVLVIERGPGFAASAYDKISIVHLTLAVLAAAGWAALGAMHRAGAARRAAAAGAIALAALAVETALFPRVLAGPAADVDAAVIAAHLGATLEMRPLWPTDAATLRDFLFGNGWALLGIAGALPRLAAGPRRAGFAPLLFVVLAAGSYAVLGCLHARFTMFAGLLAAPLVADLLMRVRAGLADALIGRAAATALLLLGPGLAGLGVAALAGRSSFEREVATVRGTCAVRDALPALGRPPTVVIANLNFGPELLWRTPHGVLGTPFHRNRDGILDGVAFFAAVDDRAAQAIAARRGAGLVLFCPSLDGATHVDPRALGRRLLAGEVPAWLAALPEAGKGFHVYAIAGAP